MYVKCHFSLLSRLFSLSLVFKSLIMKSLVKYFCRFILFGTHLLKLIDIWDFFFQIGTISAIISWSTFSASPFLLFLQDSKIRMWDFLILIVPQVTDVLFNSFQAFVLYHSLFKLGNCHCFNVTDCSFCPSILLLSPFTEIF